MYFKMTRAAVTVAGGAVALCLGSVPAALAAPAQNGTFVPCNAWALHTAINDASSGDTLDLAPGCTYYLPHALPDIMTDLTIVGYHSTLTRARWAGDFSLLKVGCSAGDLTVINVNFTDGGGDIDRGGAIDVKDGTLHVTGGIFTGNETDNEGGAIYNDGHMWVNNATFTDNLAPYGGAIENDYDAWIEGSSFTWNKAPTLWGDPDNSEGGAIYNDDNMQLADSGFLGNSTGGYGGAIYTEDDLHAAHITVTANEADFDGGGIYNDGDSYTADLYNSTVFGNQPNNCSYVDGCF
jgi:predicted outer membrane repeat protein